ncbi:Histidine kinase [Forsythia ovata]|uniref:Histidine kinase n=1 Tax=Forsythia ovata TaxID=205694 RepID=A0ABD1T5J3_9LAMI
MLDTSKDFHQQEVASTISENFSNNMSGKVEPAEKDVTLLDKMNVKHENGITVEDIMKTVTAHFDLDADILGYTNEPREKIRLFLRKLYKCESWLIEHFAVKDFESLGYGEFLMFIDKYIDLLPHALQKCLIDDPIDKASVEAYLLPLQLTVLLSQASSNMWENENIGTQNISELLIRQFPLVCFKIVQSESVVNFVDIRKSKWNLSSGCVIFSATLFGMPHFGGDSSAQNEKNLSETSRLEINSYCKAGILGVVTTKDAIEVLCRAPMLVDLELWSHWNLVFAPSLGPFLQWLLNDVNTREFMCLVTKGGKVIRLDHSATVESFLEVFLCGSSFETAVKLLSLISLYGGERNVPVSLLKCHAQQAFEVLLKNSWEMELRDEQHFLAHGKMLDRQLLLSDDKSNCSSHSTKTGAITNDPVSMASFFVLDCLGYLPIEFCSFAADILLAGLQSFVRNAPSTILSECEKIEQRLMLHEVGISLNVVEWISDYHLFNSSTAPNTSISSQSSRLKAASSGFSLTSNMLNSCSSGGKMMISDQVNTHAEDCVGVNEVGNFAEISVDNLAVDSTWSLSKLDTNSDPARIIETIRLEEFGLDPSLSAMETRMLKKQHARLGRALHCLSHELYSQDSHFLLELVQNADDNIYPGNVEPTLVFILQEEGIIVLNNEHGFSAENIRALCDVGNSTKKTHLGYIGKKGIGFKSVFRVTDTPEIHSGGFHIRFDITEGQIGFILPTVVPPCNVDLYARLVTADADQINLHLWNTCILLPFRSKLLEEFALNNIVSMFSDLHPSLLLFLRRLQCIKFRNMLDDTLIVMKKEVVGNGIVKVYVGEEKMTWFVVSQKLQADVFRPDVRTTEISIAFTLWETENGDYIPHLDQQPVFAFLPLRTYGFKFILQGDFVLPSSREEVDGNSPWNQWLMSEFPGLFVGAERSFCDLPCFRGSPGKAVSAFMNFVPLQGDVHGFFSSLPRMIISKLRASNCLILEGDENVWVPPCKVLRSWTEQDRALLPDSLLREHLGLGFLDKDIVLSDSLARALGVEDYGPKVLLQIISSLCCSKNGIKSMSLIWLSSWLNAIYVISSHSSGKTSLNSGAGLDLLVNLRKIPFIPLSDGRYSSVDEGTIWLHSDALSARAVDDYSQQAFPILSAKLRTVSPALLSAAAAAETSCFDTFSVQNVTRMLYRIGVQRLSAHEIVKVHILPAISGDRDTWVEDLMTEYLSFVMFHLQSSCPNCCAERASIITELCSKVPILTNHGYKRPIEVPIHFSKDFGNTIDLNKLFSGMDVKWHEVDSIYLNHSVTKSVSGGMLVWRSFFQDLGITDFVRIVQVEKNVVNVSEDTGKMLNGDMLSTGSVVIDWESEELVHLLEQLSTKGDREKCSYLLEILNTLWDTCFSDKVTGYCCDVSGERKPFKSSLISMLHNFRWINSSIDNELQFPKDVFHDCEAVRLILGASAPYAVPKVSEKMLRDIEFKTQVTLYDMLAVLKVWRRSTSPFKASILQMSRWYSRIWKEMATSKLKIIEDLSSGPFIFVPCLSVSSFEDTVPGVFMSVQEVHWHDSIVSMNQAELFHPKCDLDVPHHPFSKSLCNVYPDLHDFFVKECGVNEIPPLCSYLEILLHLSTIMLPSQAAREVFQVFVMWADGLQSGSLCSGDVEYLKDCLLRKEYAVLPTAQDKWVSLHPSFGLVCWCDDDTLREEFKNCNDIVFLYFGVLTDEEKQVPKERISTIMHRLGIPALSEVITSEAIYYGPTDSSFIASLVEWVLPYAQRYIYNAHPDKYFQLKQSGFQNPRCLRIIVVEKLFYRNVLKGSHVASKRRSECSCLLQGNILYATRESDYHSLFMELSRLLYGGNPELHFANFLHVLTIMAESGSTEEQMEIFILNSQKVPKLPAEESAWSLSTVPSSSENDEALMQHHKFTAIDETNSMKFKKKTGINSNWPPVGWKTAPRFNFAHVNQSETQAAWILPTTKNHDLEGTSAQRDFSVHTECTMEGDRVPSASVADSLEAEASEYLSDHVSNIVTPDMSMELDSVDAFNSCERDQLSFGTTNAQQALLTGRIGELVAFKYFVGKAGKTFVKWVNEVDETGLPYDIVIGGEEESKEYIEVKSTKSAKDWFAISVKEWQFAVDKGESFSIARTVLTGNKLATVTIYKNPVRLCQLGELQLVVLIPKQESSSIIS